MSKFEKIRQGYLTLSTICMLIYVACGIVAGVIYGIRYIGDKLQSRKAAEIPIEGTDDDGGYSTTINKVPSQRDSQDYIIGGKVVGCFGGCLDDPMI